MRACPRCFSVYSAEPEHCSFDGERLSATGDPMVGRVLEGYRLDRLLGIGGTGCVYRGTVLATKEPCAVKLLFREMAADRNIATRFKREAEAVKRIKHPNVVQIIDYGTTLAGPVYLVMELLEGKTLKEVLEEEAPLPPARATRIAQQLAGGLAEAHRVGFVHRDLKPGNIIVSGNGGHEKVKILDFGIVASLHDREGEERLTKTGYIVGTPTYMAPEQIDPKAITPQVDVYALGVILYEMLSGQPPFLGSLEQILVGKMTQAPKPLENAGALGDLVLRFLEIDPLRRPSSALQASAELGRLTLLGEDPQTIRADMPDLVPFASVGFPVGTVKIYDLSTEGDGNDTGPLGAPPAQPSMSGWFQPRAPTTRGDTLIVEQPPEYVIAGPTPSGPRTTDQASYEALEIPTKVGPAPPDEADTGETNGADLKATTEGPPPPFLSELSAKISMNPLSSNPIASDAANEAPTFDNSELYADTKLTFSQGLVLETKGPTAGDTAPTQEYAIPVLFPKSEPLSPGEPIEATRPAIPRPRAVTVEKAQPPAKGRWFFVVAFAALFVIAVVIAWAVINKDTVIIDVPPITK